MKITYTIDSIDRRTLRSVRSETDWYYSFPFRFSKWKIKTYLVTHNLLWIYADLIRFQYLESEYFDLLMKTCWVLFWPSCSILIFSKTNLPGDLLGCSSLFIDGLQFSNWSLGELFACTARSGGTGKWWNGKTSRRTRREKIVFGGFNTSIWKRETSCSLWKCSWVSMLLYKTSEATCDGVRACTCG